MTQPLSSKRIVLADELAEAVERFMKMHDALENPRPAAAWFALKDALKAYKEAE